MNIVREFRSAFEHNFYETKEFVDFCADVSGKTLQRQNIHGRNISIIGTKNPSISVYSEDEQRLMKRHGISFLSVTANDNTRLKEPSFIEYPILFRGSYDEQLAKTDRTFRKYVSKVKKLPYSFEVVTALSDSLFEEIYFLYRKQMKRLKSFYFSKSFFRRFLQVPESIVLVLYYEKNIAGYSFSFKYHNNLYTSVGGINHEYFSKFASYAMYHEKIKFASKNNLHIHMGLGENGSGYNAFKLRAGAIALSCINYPDRSQQFTLAKKMHILVPASFLLRQYGRLFPKRLIYTLMPFT